MRYLARPHQIPPRVAVGAYFLDSGLSKFDADEETAQGVHGMAVRAYPFLGKVDPVLFTRVLSISEMALGAALLTPVVPSLVAGAALTGFAGGLIGLYLRTPGMTRPGGVRPSDQGKAVAKDVWLLGIGLGLVVDECVHECAG
ncbi:hypothetical protein Skr01_55920 [Sphaerisporangium krabiense]|uniref:Putative membrane protein YphA (DoxX/SURF4 family) n=1 Tax=Sphaerisporangium krabiense TaxID=763782 RepID=A0A7W8ZBD8_9ACTN|nr:hypothetical protein [Sphaerisporangium krabiense]MBB5630810.1 putative membrane protein YphA (DoxX/SURF4 family) [Sphaerisporangium krabiense]GII65507.1 hypothetical protein Skr01_55920 [Sphaerisporangium krabiense]